MPNLSEFLEELSSGAPVPGGGSAAALEAAMGASLVAMVANLTVGRKRFADVHDEVLALRDQAIAARDRAYRLIDEDIAAYQVVADGLALPRSTEEEKGQRRERLQEALKGAAEPPLETMRVAGRVLGLAARLVQIGNPSAVSDVGTAAASARAAYQAARLNVEANAALVRDEAWLAWLRQELATLPDPDDLEREVLAAVTTSIRGEGA